VPEKNAFTETVWPFSSVKPLVLQIGTETPAHVKLFKSRLVCSERELPDGTTVVLVVGV
jgi:hypothetical protein